MKRFGLHFLMFCTAIVVAPAIYVNAGPMFFFNYEYPMWRYAHNSIYAPEAVSPDAVLAVGDSRLVAGLIPTALSPGSRSIGVGGATGIEVYFALKHYLEHHAAPAKIVISLAPSHFSYAEAFWDRSVKFHFLGLTEAVEVMRRNQELGEHTIPYAESPFSNLLLARLADAVLYRIDPTLAQSARFLDLLALRIGFLPHYQYDLLEGKLFTRYQDNRRKLDEMIAEHGHALYGTANGTSQLNLEAGEKHFRAAPLLTEYFEKSLELCRERKIGVYYRTMPFSRRSETALSPQYRADFERHMAAVFARHPEVIADFAIRSISDNYFGDASHLNAAGAALVSDDIKHRLAAVSPDRDLAQARDRQ